MSETAKKAALSEVKNKPHVYTFKGERFEFPPRMDDLPGRAMRKLGKGETLEGLYLMLGDDEERFDALNPTFGDLQALDKWIGKTYGFGSAGESQASKDS